jgi:anti-sigma B factor antagonist
MNVSVLNLQSAIENPRLILRQCSKLQKGGYMSLKVNSGETRPGVFAVSPIGSLDGNTYKIFETTVEAVLKEMPDVIIFDLEFLDYINSMGVRVLLKTKKELEKNNGKIMFAHLQPQIRKVFDILNALPSLQVFTSIQELDQYLDTMQKAAR